MKQPGKWKETIDPFTITFNNFKLTEVLGYPHARNDVFYVKGLHKNDEVYAFLKYSAQSDSDISNEIKIVSLLGWDFVPRILDYDKEGKWCITKEMYGERLSYILGEDKKEKSINYMYEYGKTLANIHTAKIICEKVKHRKFFDIPKLSELKKHGIDFIYNYLVENKPKNIDVCFCHGDFHYANVLWNNQKISAVLDWELSGLGNKEFDIAWSIINRPGQDFLKTQKEVNEFLRGYKSVSNYNKKYVNYYMCLIYSHFIGLDKNNQQYRRLVLKYLKRLSGSNNIVERQ